MTNIAVLVSGGGTNLQALINAQAASQLGGGRLSLVLSSSGSAYALERAKSADIPTAIVERKHYPTRSAFTDALLETLHRHQIDLIVLAGFLYILSPHFIRQYQNRILNVHPSLIPAFCGDGYYGLKVHEQALQYGVKYTGATVHFVSEETDAGPIILQKPVQIRDDDTPETLQLRVMQEAEWELLPQAVSLYCQNKLELKGRVVHIKP